MTQMQSCRPPPKSSSPADSPPPRRSRRDWRRLDVTDATACSRRPAPARIPTTSLPTAGARLSRKARRRPWGPPGGTSSVDRGSTPYRSQGDILFRRQEDISFRRKSQGGVGDGGGGGHALTARAWQPPQLVARPRCQRPITLRPWCRRSGGRAWPTTIRPRVMGHRHTQPPLSGRGKGGGTCAVSRAGLAAREARPGR